MTNGPSSNELKGAHDFVEMFRGRFGPRTEDQAPDEPAGPQAATDHSQGHGNPPAAYTAPSGADEFAAMLRGSIRVRPFERDLHN